MTAINLSKGSGPVSMRKTANVRATAWWSSSTDYDLYALIVLRNGQVLHIANFDAKDTPAVPSYLGIRLGKDQGRSAGSSGQAVETLDMSFSDEIAAVIPVAYSAQSNGGGSFFKYKVGLGVDNGAGDTVTIDASNANKDNAVYTCVPAIIYNGTDGQVWIENVEMYSRRGSENRPAAQLLPDGRVQVTMDAGPRNKFK